MSNSQASDLVNLMMAMKRQLDRIETTMETQLERIETKMERIETTMETKMERIETTVKTIDEKLQLDRIETTMETQLERIETKTERIETTVETKLERIETTVKTIEEEINAIDVRSSALVERLSKQEQYTWVRNPLRHEDLKTYVEDKSASVRDFTRLGMLWFGTNGGGNRGYRLDRQRHHSSMI